MFRQWPAGYTLNSRPIIKTNSQVTQATRLTTGSRVILGRHHVFRYNDPQEARQSRYNLAAIAGDKRPGELLRKKIK